MTSRSADFDNRPSSDASETKGKEAAAMHCRSNLFVLCRQILWTSVNAVSAAAVSVAVSSHLAPGSLGLGFAVCRLSGLFTFTQAASPNLAANTKSVLAVWIWCGWRFCGCYSAPQQPVVTAGLGTGATCRYPGLKNRRWRRSCCQFLSSQTVLV